MKKLLRNIHLYLGLVAGLVIAIVCITGAMLVFEKEWLELFYPGRYFVAPHTHRASLEEMKQSLLNKVPGAAIESIRLPSEERRTVEWSYAIETNEKKRKRKGTSYPSKKQNKFQAFINPYTAQVIEIYDYKNSFFSTVLSVHRRLLAGDTGKMITGISAILFLVILVTGLYLWWPGKKKKIKNLLTVRWGAKWKRLNHDVHVVIGFYAALFLFVIAFTGLSFSFKWFNKGMYWITNSPPGKTAPAAVVTPSATHFCTLDTVYENIRKRFPSYEYCLIKFPTIEKGFYTTTILPKKAVHDMASHLIFSDPVSGKTLEVRKYEDRSPGHKMQSWMLPLHTGTSGGMAGRTIALLACIAGCTFPVTGTIMWLNRIKKKKKEKNALP
jgi:uncharacterized iron-regulated membrane protein